jgi:hypothetical protein
MQQYITEIEDPFFQSGQMEMTPRPNARGLLINLQRREITPRPNAMGLLINLQRVEITLSNAIMQ